MKQLKAVAIIRTAKTEPWVENFVVDSHETAEEEVKLVVKFFNDTLKPGEEPRIFVKLDEVLEEEVEDDDLLPDWDDIALDEEDDEDY